MQLHTSLCYCKNTHIYVKILSLLKEKLDEMSRYKKFLEDPTQKLSKSTAYDRRIAQIQHNDLTVNENRRVRDYFK